MALNYIFIKEEFLSGEFYVKKMKFLENLTLIFNSLIFRENG